MLNMEDKAPRKNLEAKLNPPGEIANEENFEQVTFIYIMLKFF